MILHATVDGPEDAPPLVLVGSLGTTAQMWRPQVAALAGPRRLIRLDARGHGRSPVPPGPYAIADLAQDVLDTLDDLGVDRFDYCGLSIGGMIGQWLGAFAPDRVQRLVLLFTAAVAPDPAVFADRATTVRDAGTTAGLVDGLLPRWLTDGHRAAHPADAAWLGEMVAASPAEGYAACCEAIAAMDLWPDLHRVVAPTLVVGGAQDGSLPPEQGRLIADAVPRARFVLLDPAGHLGSVERADAVNALIAEHLGLPL